MTNGWIVRLSASVLCVYALSACASASQEREGGLAVRPAEQAVPQSLAEGVASDPLPFDPLVRRGRLENGLTWYIRPNSRPENRAELRLVVNAGSILEDSTQLGLAHVVEHMAFNGTEEFEKQEIVRYLESVGTRFGADLNAYTSFDETVYELTVPTDSAGLLQKGLHILAEWAHAVTFDSAEVERERPVVLEEWRVGQGAGARLRDIQFPVLFAGSAYAERLPIGTEQSLHTFRHDDLVRFYREWYRPELMAVVVVGDFDADYVESLVRQEFGGIAAGSGAPREMAEVPGIDSTRFAIATDPEATGTSVNVLWMHGPDSVRTVADYRERMIHALYGNMLDSRFGEIAQRPFAPFLGASNSYGPLVPARNAYALGAAVADTGILQGLEALLVEAERVARHGFTAGELERAKAGNMRAVELAYAEREKTPSGAFTQAYVGSFLDGEPVTAVSTDLELHERLLPGIELSEVNALARQWAASDDRVVLVSAPEKDDVVMPSPGDLRAAFARVDAMQIEPWQDNVADSPLVAVVPAAGSIVGESIDSATGITTWELSNGARVLLKPTDFRDDEILFRAWSPGGSSLVADSLLISATFATSIVELGGLGSMDLPQLEKALAGTAASVSPSIGSLEESMSGAAASRDLELMFQLAYLYFTEPRRDSSAYVSLRQRIMPILQNRGRSPESAFSDTLQATLAQGHPRARPLTPERLNELNMDAALRIYRERFASAGDFTFALAGSFEVDSVRELVKQWVASLPDDGRREQARDVGIRPPEGVVSKLVKRGSEPRATTQIIITGPAEFSQEHQLSLSALGEVLNIRLRDALREDLGGTYGAGVSVGLQREPYGAFSISVGFGSAPERVDELSQVVFAHLDSLKRAPPRDEEVSTVRTMMLRSRETSMRQNGFWISQMAAYDRMGLPFAGIPGGAARINALTPARIQQAAQRYLSDPGYVQVTLIPEGEG